MALSDELQRLADLRQQGALTEDEFQRAKARLLEPGSTVSASASLGDNSISRLRRSRTERWLGGVCGGIARHTNVEPWIWRLGFAFLFLFWGTGLLFYILLWIFVPEEDATAL
ncbi:PspC domain-containing protein [Aquabacterium sp.]|uniref:PspC domain-containing protein n=1 Tax=Aquabacterium sp. TaxID=1872578 RepID=UPI0035AF6AFA